jgi:hypothetical protein
MRFFTLCLILLALHSGASAAHPARRGSAGSGARPVAAVLKLEIEPRTLRLAGRASAARFVVTGRRADGTVVDLSRTAAPQLASSVAAVSPDGQLTARADGRSRVRFRLGRASAEATVEVTEVSRPRPLSYTRDIFPIFSKAGCSQGVCHGNAGGKGGLKLSLRGQDPAADYEAIVRAGGGRRVNRADPGRSLLLLKPSGGLPHAGGVRFTTDSRDYRAAARWIAEGTRSDAQTTPAVVRLSVFPPERVLYAGPGSPGAPSGTSQQLRVTAQFADGTTRDVTHLACYESSEPKVTIAPDGLVEAPAGGEAGVNVRYGGQMETSRLTFVPRGPAFTFRPFPVRSYIDLHVLNKLRTVRIQPSPPCDDSTFIRRAYLDALGFPPTPEEARAFLVECAVERAEGRGQGAQGSGQKAVIVDRAPVTARARLVDRLVGRPEFADFWTMKWADLLRAEERSLDPEGMRAFYGWLREGFRQDKPLDQFARELLTAAGSTYDHPATAYYRRTRSPDELAETTAQLFMGVRLGCAKCHNHPYDQWKQTDFHAMAAYFARVDRETKYKPRRQRFDAKEINGDEILVVKPAGEWNNPATDQPAQPVMLGDPSSVPAADTADRRPALASWLTRPGNPFFARAMTNRIWYHVMGRGIVDPVDDFRQSNPPSNGPLLQALADDFAARGFNLRYLVATIMKSGTYQLSSVPNALNASDRKYFSHTTPTRLTAEQMLETIGSVTGAPEEFPGYEPGSRVTQVVPTWRPHPFLRLFGQPPRETVCECERNDDATLGQSFELISGRLIDSRLRKADNRLSRLLASGKPPGEMVTELYLAAFARCPSAAELKVALGYLQTAKDRRGGLEDLAWGLMNTKEFLLRH